MGQKVHPLGFRIGISQQHSSFWYSDNKNYINLLKEDIFIRNFIEKQLPDVYISLIEIKRKLNFLTIDVHVAKPSLLIAGNVIFILRDQLAKLLEHNFKLRNITINVVEIFNPDLNPRMLTDFIRQQLEKRVPFRRVIKAAILKAQKAGAKGVKIQISGRLNGAEIARTEWVREGQVPLHTLKANIDYFNQKAQTLYGILGIKVWIYSI
uniref:Small ribosomal subunit protein uS3c n=1 Tax=Euglena clara TaxID=215708 RepID=A0A2Z4YV31_9EUGL|nr:ribosomal protein S3 [Euglena clara]AXA45470.1 ribosomal protein S3 [Euglena clara]